MSAARQPRSLSPVLRPTHLTLALATAFAALALPVQAQQASQSGSAAAAPADGQAVIVTGTRALNRTVADSASPIDIIGARELQATGTPELATALSRLLPSLNFPRPSVTDASDANRPAQLRGLSPDQVLVLVNGKRRHAIGTVNVNGTQGRGSQPVDLNAIPVAAVARIEVLRDGAAAQYGSDAIAGVVNIVLKGGAQGGEAEASYGGYDAGDGAQGRASIHAGLPLGEDGWLRVTLESRRQDHTNRALPDFRNPAEPLYGKVTQRFGDPDSKQTTLLLNAQKRLDADLEFYAFGNLGERSTQAPGFWRPALDARNIRAIYPDGYLPIEDSTSRDRALAAGVRGQTAGGWRWDASLTWGANRFDLDVTNSLNTSLGASSPRSFYAGQLQSGQTVANLDLAREFDAGLAGPLTFAWGAEARRETYEISPGEPNSYFGTGAQVFAGFRPVDAGSHSRHSEALYASVEANLTPAFSGAAAVRGEHYSDFGSASSAKLSGRYAFTPQAALRATASTGFRAPTLGQQFYSTTTTSFIGSVPYDVRTFAVTDPVGKQLGAEELKAEKSQNLSLGLLLQPAKNVTLAIDAYQVKVKDRIVLSENLTGTAVQAFLAKNGYANANGGRYFTNAIDTRTRGVDVVATWRLDLAGAGQLDLTGSFNANRTELVAVKANPAVLAQNGLAIQRIGRVEEGRITKGSPTNKLALAADYRLGSWTLHGAATRYGAFTSYNANPALDQTFDPAWVGDLSLAYRIGQWTLSAGVDNLTDRYPDRLTAATTPNTVLPYSQSAPFGFNGRYFYAKAKFTW